MISTWSFYYPDGIIHDIIYNGPEEFLEINTPKGTLPIEGIYNHFNKKVEIVDDVPTIVDYIPSAKKTYIPEVEYKWNDTKKEHELSLTVLGIKENKFKELKDKLLELDHSNIIDNTNMYEYQANETSRNALYQKYQTAMILKENNSNFEVDWTLADNSVVTITDKDIKKIIQAIEIRSAKLRATYTKLRKDAELALSKEDVDKIFWPL